MTRQSSAAGVSASQASVKLNRMVEAGVLLGEPCCCWRQALAAVLLGLEAVLELVVLELERVLDSDVVDV